MTKAEWIAARPEREREKLPADKQEAYYQTHCQSYLSYALYCVHRGRPIPPDSDLAPPPGTRGHYDEAVAESQRLASIEHERIYGPPGLPGYESSRQWTAARNAALQAAKDSVPKPTE